MNDTERDLRELFDAKAREAGGAPSVTREVLRRGRRRQAGTVAVAGITALAVAAVAVVSLQALHRADTSVPGGSNGNPAFTATIQSFTIAVPKGWTLIDQWPLGSIMAVDSTSTKFSCVGTPVEAGSGKNASSGSSSADCPDQQAQTTPEPPTIPQGGLPMLTLSNDDPGLGGSVCNAGGALPAASATLYIGLDYGVTRTAGWESTVQAWPDPLTNVLEGDLPSEQMPCGPGGYAHFQTGGLPYIAWAGFGSEVTDADRQAIIDAFNGMQVRDAEIAPASTDLPGYVLTGGTVGGSTTMWNIEVSPTDRNVDMHYSEVGGRAGGVADFRVPDVPLEVGYGHGIAFGAVTFDADRVELRPSDGSAPIIGTILQLPDSLNAPFAAFVVPTGAGGDIVAVGTGGDLGDVPTDNLPAPEPTLADRRVQSDLRNAYVAAKTFYVDANTYEGFTPAEAVAIEPSLAYNTDAQAVAGEISIRDVAADHIILAETTGNGTVFCIAEQPDGTTTYGAVDAQTAAECVGGEVAWGQDTAPSPVGSQVIVPDVPGGYSWTVQLESGEIVLRDGDQVLTGVSTTPDGAMSVTSYVFGNGVDAEAVIFGIIDPSVSAVAVGAMGADLANTDDTLLADGRSVFWWSGPGSLGTRVTAVDQQCDVVKSYVLGPAGLEVATGGATPFLCGQAGAVATP